MKSAGLGIGLIVGVLALIWLGTGIFIVQEGQQAVVTRFGRYNSTTGAGFNWRLPYPIERHEVVNVTQIRSVDVGRDAVIKATGLRESAMLTEDENIVEIKFAVQYRLNDARAYLFESKNPGEAVVQAAETAVREVVGKMRMDSALADERDQIAPRVRTLMQQILDRYKVGIEVVGINLQQGGVRPPEQVQAAFDDVLKAGQERERAKNEAQAYANDVIPRATGSASRLKEEAEGYKSRVVSQAQGDGAALQRRAGPVPEGAAGHPRPPVPRDHAADLRQRHQGAGRVAPGLQPAVPAARQDLQQAAGRRRRRSRRARAAPCPPARPPPPAAILPSAADARTRDNARGRERESVERRQHTMNRIGFIAASLLVVLALLSSMLFVVDQRQFGVVYALGQIKEVITEPGLNFKLPPPFQNVSYIDKRLLTLDSVDTEPMLTAEKQRVVIDWYVRWRISDPSQYIRNVGLDEAAGANQLNRVVRNAFQEEINRFTVRELLSAKREQLMADVKREVLEVVKGAKPWGVDVIDVRITRADYVEAITESVYRRMEAERKRVANELRSTGAAEGEKIRADADRQRESPSPTPTATRRRSRARAMPRPPPSTASRSAAIPQFAQFYRSLEAYKRQLQQEERRAGGRPERHRVLPRLPWRRHGRRRRTGRAPPAPQEISGLDGDTLLGRAGPGAGVRGPVPVPLARRLAQTFQKLLQLRDGQLRFFGLCSVLLGLALLWLVG
jgi:membrane protease subunit HflK